MSIKPYPEQELTVIALLKERPDSAIEQIQRMVNGSIKDDPFASYALGEIYRAGGDPVSAGEHVRNALETDPASPLTRAVWSYLVLDGGRRVAALSELSSAVGGLERPRFYLGLALGSAYRYSEAIEHLKACVETAPDDLQAWVHLGHALRRSGDREGAAEAAHVAASLATTLPWKRAAAQQLFQARRYRESFRVARSAAREFKGARAKLLPWTLPIQVNAFIADCIAAFPWILFLVISLYAPISFGLLGTALTITFVRLLGTYSSGSRQLSIAMRRFKRWKKVQSAEMPASTSEDLEG